MHGITRRSHEPCQPPFRDNIPSMKLLHAIALFVAAFPAFGQEAQGKNPWQLVYEVEGIKVYQRISQNPALKEYKATGILKLPAEALTAVMMDRPHYREFFPYLVENRQFEKEGAHYSYERIKAPFVSERDYTVSVHDEDLPDGGFRYRFHDANDKGPPPAKGRVRVQVVDGSWEILPKGKRHSLVTYHVFTDPGGSIPNFIINMANKKGVSRAVLALRDRTRSILASDAKK